MKRLVILAVLLCGSAFAVDPTPGSCPTGSHWLQVSTNTVVSSTTLGCTGAWFVSASGSDSNNGTSESTPFLHAPYMPNCSGNCATVTAQSAAGWAGEWIVFKPGDTYHFGITTDSAGNPAAGGRWLFNTGNLGGTGGTPTNPIFITVDPGWSGASGTRVKFDGDNPACNANNAGSGGCNNGTTTCINTNCPGLYYVNSCTHTISGGNQFINNGNTRYFVYDNIEFTGYCQNSIGQPGTDNMLDYGSLCTTTSCTTGFAIVFQNLYIHNATHVQFAGGNGQAGTLCSGSNTCFDTFVFHGSVTNGTVGEAIHDSVVDFSDSDPIGVGLAQAGFYDVAYNIFRYNSQLLVGQRKTFHDNLIEFFYENGHSNILEETGTLSINKTMYNNVFRHNETYCSSGCGGNLDLSSPSGFTDFIFNNIYYDQGNIGGNFFILLNNGTTQGTYDFFNNTIEASQSGNVIACGASTGGGAINAVNNHFISDAGSIFSLCNSFLTETTDLLMSHATATSDGYTSSQTFAYSPTSGGNPTVGAGTNKNSSFCSSLSSNGFSDAAAQCRQSTGYACSYAGNGAAPVCSALTATARPTSAAWDQGAYEYPLAGAGSPGGPVINGSFVVNNGKWN